jgi:hypothetical protein
MPAEKSGAHIGAIRNWIQWNCFNGDQVDWGSDEKLNLKREFTVKSLEDLAQMIADDVIDDPRLITVDKLQDRWEKAGHQTFQVEAKSPHQILIRSNDAFDGEYLTLSDALSAAYRKLRRCIEW